MVVKVSAAVPVLLTVTVCAALVVPTVCEAKVSVDTDSDIAGTPASPDAGLVIYAAMSAASVLFTYVDRIPMPPLLLLMAESMVDALEPKAILLSLTVGKPLWQPDVLQLADAPLVLLNNALPRTGSAPQALGSSPKQKANSAMTRPR